MSNSKLVSYARLNPNCTKPRNHAIDKITIHHMAGNLTVEQCGALFASTNRKVSSNYGIGTDGRVGLYVDEANRSWCSSNAANDHRAVTIEVANDRKGGDWHVSDRALAKLIDLCVDICQRNGIARLNFTGDKSGNLTMHKWFTATNCPGTYLESRFPYIAEQVNARLAANNNTSIGGTNTVTIELPIIKMGANGSEVTALQRLLRSRGFKGKNGGVLTLDGDFGSNTDYALRLFQKSVGLTVDGICGKATWAAILRG